MEKKSKTDFLFPISLGGKVTKVVLLLSAFTWTAMLTGSTRVLAAAPGVSESQVVLQQSNVIKGKVVDVNGEPIIGANVMVKGTTNGVITDYDGVFSLKVSPRAILVISYIGYLSQEIQANGKGQLQIVLKEDAQNLEEVVVVGYGTMKKKDLMGATSGVSGDNLATNSNISVGNALQGKMSGISVLSSTGFPGAESTLSIRGVGTFGSGSNSPLLIIDGVPVNGGLETLNPADIESVNVLKDASSAAIYGSRAANGVVLITTKRGTSGKAKLSVNATWGIQTPSNMMDVLDATEFVSAVQEMRDNKKAIDGGTPIRGNTNSANSEGGYGKG